MASAIENNWRSDCKSVQEIWCKARKNKLFTDVGFLVGHSTTPFTAHKIFLASNSSVFKAMFFGEQPEKNKVIPIPDIYPETFDCFLRYVYGETPTFSKFASAADTYLFAIKYEAPELQRLVESCITKMSLDNHQFWEILHWDPYFFVPAVLKKCSEYLGNNATALLKSELLNKVSLQVMKSILLLDRLEASEFALLSAVVRWVHANCRQKAMIDTILVSLLGHVRFSNLTVDEFCRFKDAYPSVIGDKDSFLILKHLNQPSAYALPKWCSESKVKRHTNVFLSKTSLVAAKAIDREIQKAV